MSYFLVKRKSDSKIVKYRLGKVAGIKLNSRGEVDYKNSAPFIVYYGDGLKKIINTNHHDNDELYIINEDGTTIETWSVNFRKYYVVKSAALTSQRTLTDVIAAEDGKEFRIQQGGYVLKSLSLGKEFGYYSPTANQIQGSIAKNAMILQDFENNTFWITEPNERTWTGGVRDNASAGDINFIPIDGIYGSGIMSFSEKPSGTIMPPPDGKFAYKWGEYWLYDAYFNSRYRSSLGRTGVTPLHIKDPKYLRFVNLDLISSPFNIKNILANIDDNNENINPNEPDENDEPDDYP